jgi:hypothetical protein
MRNLLLTSTLGAALFAAESAYALSLAIETGKEINMDRPSGQCQGFTEVVSNNGNLACAVTASGGSFQGGGEFGRVQKENGVWIFRGSSCQPGTFFHVTCFRVDP